MDLIHGWQLGGASVLESASLPCFYASKAMLNLSMASNVLISGSFSSLYTLVQGSVLFLHPAWLLVDDALFACERTVDRQVLCMKINKTNKLKFTAQFGPVP